MHLSTLHYQCAMLLCHGIKSYGEKTTLKGLILTDCNGFLIWSINITAIVSLLGVSCFVLPAMPKCKKVCGCFFFYTHLTKNIFNQKSNMKSIFLQSIQLVKHTYIFLRLPSTFLFYGLGLHNWKVVNSVISSEWDKEFCAR